MTNSANISFHISPRVVCPLCFHSSSLTFIPSEPANSRSTARQKLTRLTRQQFQELSTDVYDELIRRKNNSDSNQGAVIVFLRTPLHHISHFTLVPFLPVRDDFHPKRNQARQKLATLPTSRFKDLSSDVYYELVRRYPEFKEEVCFILSHQFSPLDHHVYSLPMSPLPAQHTMTSHPPTFPLRLVNATESHPCQTVLVAFLKIESVLPVAAHVLAAAWKITILL